MSTSKPGSRTSATSQRPAVAPARSNGFTFVVGIVVGTAVAFLTFSMRDAAFGGANSITNRRSAVQTQFGSSSTGAGGGEGGVVAPLSQRPSLPQARSGEVSAAPPPVVALPCPAGKPTGQRLVVFFGASDQAP